MNNFASLLPVIFFLVIAVCISIVIRKRNLSGKAKDFESEYYIGSRSLGGFVLALTTVATYGSVSSFVGGPGQAWSIGWGFAYMGCCQVTALILLYGIVGKKLALVSRKTNAITIVDVIRHRYQSNAIAIAAAAIIVVFFIASMVAQFVGGAKLFEAVTGYSYTTGLVLFGIAAIVFTTIGGFRGVAFTDVLCGIVMLLGLVVLLGGVLHAGGGYENVIATIKTNQPQMFEPLSAGNMPISLYISQWLLVGIFTFCLPQSAVRCIGAKSVSSMHRAMIIGTVVIGFMMIAACSIGILSAGVLTGDLASYGGSVDNIIPAAVVASLPPALAGVAIIGPIAASISTVSSLLIVCTSSLVRDIVASIRGGKAAAETELAEAEETKPAQKKGAFAGQIITLVIGLIVFFLALVPPDVIWKINMFAFGGLETAFCWVLVMGLFWKRANKTGALLSMILGTIAYCVCMYFGIKFFGLHQITIGIVVSLVAMIVGSLVSKKESEDVLSVYFPR